jgi:hypothetical protein
MVLFWDNDHMAWIERYRQINKEKEKEKRDVHEILRFLF